MGMRMSKPWVELTETAIAGLPAQLGVYQIGDADGQVQRIGYAGGKEPFGMRTALEKELAAGGTHFRLEFTHAYLTRWQEMLMIYQADYGTLPPGNGDLLITLGTLSPGSPATEGAR